MLAIKYFEKILSNNKSSESLILKAKKWIVLLSLLMDIDYNEVQKTIHKYELSNNIELLNMAEEYKSLDFKSPKVLTLGDFNFCGIPALRKKFPLQVPPSGTQVGDLY